MQRTRSNGVKIILPSVLLIIIILLDQITKCFFHNRLSPNQDIVVIKGFLTFATTFNEGAAFSFLNGVEWAQTFFKVLTGVATIGFYIFFMYARTRYKLLSYSVVLIFAGMMGNFIDRLAFSYVVDFISCNFWGYGFPVFNVADMSLCIGVALFILHYLFLDKEAIFKKKETKKNAKIDI